MSEAEKKRLEKELDEVIAKYHKGTIESGFEIVRILEEYTAIMYEAVSGALDDCSRT